MQLATHMGSRGRGFATAVTVCAIFLAVGCRGGAARSVERSRTLEVVVLDGVTGEPVEGATVRWAQGAPGLEASWLDELLDRRIARARATGLVTTTDAAGVARLTPAHPWNLIVAQTEDRWGSVTFREWRLGAPRELEIFPDEPIRVRALDAGGAPVGGVFVQLDSGAHVGGAHAVAVTDESTGIATFEHGGALLGTAWRGDAESRVHARLQVAGDMRDGVLVRAEHCGGDAIDLVLPPTGSIEVRLREADGAACRGTGLVSLDWGEAFYFEIGYDTPVPARVLTQMASSGRADTQVVHAEGGVARFPHVALGKHFVVLGARHFTAHCRGDDFVGPTAAGERVRVDLDIGQDSFALRGRAVDESGEPIRNERLVAEHREPPVSGSDDELLMHFASARRPYSNVWTDDEGRFALAVETHRAEHPLVLAQGRGSRHPRSVLLDVSAYEDGGSVELDDVVFEAPPVIASGRLLDSTGLGLQDAFVSLQEFPIHLAAESPRDDQLIARAESDGSFELRAYVQSEPLLLWFVAPFRTPVGRFFEPGESIDLEFEFRAQGTVEVVLDGPEDTDWSRYSISCERPDEVELREYFWIPRRRAEARETAFEWLPVDEYRVRVHETGGVEPIFETLVTVEADRTTRVGPIELP